MMLSSISIGNPDNLKYLADGISNNTSNTELYLEDNNIGSNPDNLKHIFIYIYIFNIKNFNPKFEFSFIVNNNYLELFFLGFPFPS